MCVKVYKDNLLEFQLQVDHVLLAVEVVVFQTKYRYLFVLQLVQ